MVVDSKQRRSRFGNQRFLFSIFCTFFFFLLYLLALHYIPAPELFLKQLGAVPRRGLLSWVLDYQIQANFIISVLWTLFNAASGVFWKKQEIEKKQDSNNIQSTLSRFLKPNFIAFVGLFKYWSLIKNSSYLVLLTYLSFFVSNSVFELIAGFLSDYGVCRGFDLIFFTSKFPLRILWTLFSSLLRAISFNGDYSDLKKSLSLLLIFFIAYLFISMSSVKWEVPINTNKIGPSENYIDYLPTFLLQRNFDIFLLTLISNSITAFGIFWDLLLTGLKRLPEFSIVEELSVLQKSFAKFSIDSSSFKEVFFAINSSMNPFSGFYQRAKENASFFPAIICWIFTVHFVNWLIISSSQLNSWKISKRLEESGVYLDNTRPGRQTRKLIGHAVNKLVASWAFYLTLLAMFFDNVVFSLMESVMKNKVKSHDLVSHNSLSHRSLKPYNIIYFPSLLAVVSTAVDLSKQITKKYSHFKFYD